MCKSKPNLFKQNTPSPTAIPAFNSPSSYSWCRARRLVSATARSHHQFIHTHEESVSTSQQHSRRLPRAGAQQHSRRGGTHRLPLVSRCRYEKPPRFLIPEYPSRFPFF